MGGLPFAQAREAASWPCSRRWLLHRGRWQLSPRGEVGPLHTYVSWHAGEMSPPPVGRPGEPWPHQLAVVSGPGTIMLAQQRAWGPLSASGGCADLQSKPAWTFAHLCGRVSPLSRFGWGRASPRGLTSCSMGLGGRSSQRVLQQLWLLDLLLMGQSRSRGCRGPWWCLPPPPPSQREARATDGCLLWGSWQPAGGSVPSV